MNRELLFVESSSFTVNINFQDVFTQFMSQVLSPPSFPSSLSTRSILLLLLSGKWYFIFQLFCLFRTIFSLYATNSSSSSLWRNFSLARYKCQRASCFDKLFSSTLCFFSLRAESVWQRAICNSDSENIVPEDGITLFRCHPLWSLQITREFNQREV